MYLLEKNLNVILTSRAHWAVELLASRMYCVVDVEVFLSLERLPAFGTNVRPHLVVPLRMSLQVLFTFQPGNGARITS